MSCLAFVKTVSWKKYPPFILNMKLVICFSHDSKYREIDTIPCLTNVAESPHSQMQNNPWSNWIVVVLVVISSSMVTVWSSKFFFFLLLLGQTSKHSNVAASHLQRWLKVLLYKNKTPLTWQTLRCTAVKCRHVQERLKAMHCGLPRQCEEVTMDQAIDNTSVVRGYGERERRRRTVQSPSGDCSTARRRPTKPRNAPRESRTQVP